MQKSQGRLDDFQDKCGNYRPLTIGELGRSPLGGYLQRHTRNDRQYLRKFE